MDNRLADRIRKEVNMIGIIGAMEEEVEQIVAAMEVTKKIQRQIEIA